MMQLSCREYMDLSFCILLILTSHPFYHLIRAFIRDKPEGRKTVLAQVHITTSYSLQLLVISSLIPVIIRIMLGPLPAIVVIIIIYILKAISTATLSFFGFSSLIKCCFLIDYNRMSSVSDRTTLVTMYSVVGAWVAAGFAWDVSYKMATRAGLIGIMEYWFYLGGHEMVKHAAPGRMGVLWIFLTFVLMTTAHVLTLVIKLIKTKLRPNCRHHILECAHIESGAHGITVKSGVLSFVFLGGVTCLVCAAIQAHLPLNEAPRSSSFYQLRYNFYWCHSLFLLVPAFWILANTELRKFSARRIRNIVTCKVNKDRRPKLNLDYQNGEGKGDLSGRDKLIEADINHKDEPKCKDEGVESKNEEEITKAKMNSKCKAKHTEDKVESTSKEEIT